MLVSVRRCLSALLVFAFLSTARAEDSALKVSVVLSGDPKANDPLQAGVVGAVPDVTIRLAKLPNTSSSGATLDEGALRDALAAARAAYINADFKACLSALPDLGQVHTNVARGLTLLSSRALVWRMACQVGGAAPEAAKATAHALSVLGLEIPDDLGSVSPEAEAVLASAQREVAATARLSVGISSNHPGLEVSLDGTATGCSTPCAIELVPGTHVIGVDGEGVTAVQRVITMDRQGSTLHFDVEPAAPELAAQQWSSRYRGTAQVDSPTSLRLLTLAVRTRHLVLVQATPAARDHWTLQGAYVRDGDVLSRSQATDLTIDELSAEAGSLLRELLERGDAIESRRLYKNPWFWVITGVVAAGTATATALVMRDPDTRSSIGFPENP